MNKMNSTEWSLFMRSFNNALDLLEEVYLQQYGVLHKDYEEKCIKGVYKFQSAMATISKANRYHGGKGFEMPWVITKMYEV